MTSPHHLQADQALQRARQDRSRAVVINRYARLTCHDYGVYVLSTLGSRPVVLADGTAQQVRNAVASVYELT